MQQLLQTWELLVALINSATVHSSTFLYTAVRYVTRAHLGIGVIGVNRLAAVGQPRVAGNILQRLEYLLGSGRGRERQNGCEGSGFWGGGGNVHNKATTRPDQSGPDRTRSNNKTR